MRRLILPAAERAAIAAHLARAYPEEGCGLLLGRADEHGVAVSSIATADNVAPEPRRHFEIDPAVILRSQRELRGGAQDIVGHFHSHPDGAAALSRTDREQADWPGLAWLVVTVSKDAVVDWRAFWLGTDAEFETMEISS